MKNISSFFNSDNAAYLSEVYQLYLKDPSSLSNEWQDFFKSLPQEEILFKEKEFSKQKNSDENFSIQARRLLHAYRTFSYRIAHTNPLQIKEKKNHPELELSFYGINNLTTPIDLGEDFFLSNSTFSELIRSLKALYCGSIGAEFMHLENTKERLWLLNRFEKRHLNFTKDEKLKILEHITQAEKFEQILNKKFKGAKRFGLEGAEALIPALHCLLEAASDRDIEEINIGMTHRGRLSVLSHIVETPFYWIIAQFQGTDLYTESIGSGDVKYHQGRSQDRVIKGKKIHISLPPNPSHLESVYPVLLGRVRAKQNLAADKSKVLGIMLHGDASFIGQGVVSESLQLSNLEGYRTGGTLHFIINNQIAFTANPEEARSSLYSSDLIKTIQAPVFHVNADDPEALLWTVQLASDFQKVFAKDILIDLVCYRRYGHNEGDEPTFTQPELYKNIKNHPTVVSLYKDQLIKEKVINENQYNEIEEKINKAFEDEFKNAQSLQIHNNDKIKPDWLKNKWALIEEKNSIDSPLTGVKKNKLKELSEESSLIPPNFSLNTKIEKLLSKRQEALTYEQVDWATAESLAFSSLLMEGYPIRLSGQDSARGTFSQRHAVWIDQKTEKKYIPLNHLKDQKAFIEVVNSPLSEAAVLGFEYGFSLSNPNHLTIWEAQFGDFANGAQIIIDQFLSASKEKWLRLSGLVLLLPHGFEGQGPEHSSARLERFLQLCAQQNIQVIYPSTPANYFHALRGQLYHKSRKPLIILTPKSLLRHPLAISSLDLMDEGTAFEPVIAPKLNETIKTVILCSGKIYYELLEEKKKQNRYTIALIRLEQFYPFPWKKIKEVLSPYRDAYMVWCQEEPKNMGAWMFLDRRLEKVLKEIKAAFQNFHYIGRKKSASPATGNFHKHKDEQQQIIKEALSFS